MPRPSLVGRLHQYYKDPRPDLVPAFKLLLSPECKLPLWDFIKYFGNMLGNNIPGVRSILSRTARRVDFAHYMEAYDRSSATLAPYREFLSKIADSAMISGQQLAVDLGSGTGNLSLKLKSSGAQVISIDCSPVSRAIHTRKDPLARIELVDIDRPSNELNFIPVGDHSVDRFCVANLWVYIKNRATIYAEMKRALKPEGLLVLAVEREGYSPVKILKDHLAKEYDRYIREGLMPLTAVVKVYADFIAKYEDLLVAADETKKLMRGIVSGEYTVFTEETIRNELEANGFEVISIEPAYAGQALIVKARPR